MKPFLMGTETEYAVSGRSSRGPLVSEEVYNLLNDALRHERPWLPDVNGGRALYLSNAGRFYVDSGGHPEYATPEVFTPAQMAAYDKAGERLLALARARIRRDRPDLEITLAKNNINPILADRLAWGCHESHTCWVPLDKVAPQLIPHLVSRMIYAGAGFLSARSAGMGYELSQRARHLVQVTGSETTSNRAIFCTRIRKAADAARQGWTRVHLICKDSHRAPLGIYLTFGTTGLLFLLINAGLKVGKGLQLADPVAAVQAVSLDPWLRVRVPLLDGRKLTALEIQECYLAECDRAVQGGDYPDWAGDVLRHWRETLEALAQDPLRLAAKLDPYCKLLIFDHEVRRAGHTWGDVHQALRTMELLRAHFTDDVVRAVLADNPDALATEVRPKYAEAVEAAHAAAPGVLDRLRFLVRLQALELNYHEVGGLYDQLLANGKVQAVVTTAADIEFATQDPPPGGRAAVRGDCIRKLREPGWLCDWRYVYHPANGTFVDLRDPWVAERKTVQREQFAREAKPDPELLDMFARLARRPT
jgi:Pup-ligase protein